MFFCIVNCKVTTMDISNSFQTVYNQLQLIDNDINRRQLIGPHGIEKTLKNTYAQQIEQINARYNEIQTGQPLLLSKRQYIYKTLACLRNIQNITENIDAMCTNYLEQRELLPSDSDIV